MNPTLQIWWGGIHDWKGVQNQLEFISITIKIVLKFGFAIWATGGVNIGLTSGFISGQICWCTWEVIDGATCGFVSGYVHVEKEFIHRRTHRWGQQWRHRWLEVSCSPLSWKPSYFLISESNQADSKAVVRRTQSFSTLLNNYFYIWLLSWSKDSKLCLKLTLLYKLYWTSIFQYLQCLQMQ